MKILNTFNIQPVNYSFTLLQVLVCVDNDRGYPYLILKNNDKSNIRVNIEELELLSELLKQINTKFKKKYPQIEISKTDVPL